jgi:hypothetical protein
MRRPMMRGPWSRIVVLSPVLAFGALGSAWAGERAAIPPAAESCVASPERVQVLVELVDTPSQRVYEAALAGSASTEPAVREAAARAAAREQEKKIKEAQDSLAQGLSALGGRELYRVRRSFNGISVLLSPDKLTALRGLSGVKAIYPRLSSSDAGPVRVAEGAAEPSPARSADRASASAAGMRAYRDPKTGRLTSSPTDAQVRELDRLLGETLNDSSEGLEVQIAPDGSKYVDLQGRFQSLSVATASPDGRTRLHCGHRLEHARRLLLEPDATGEEKE